MDDLHDFLEHFITKKGHNIKTFEIACGLGNKTIGNALKTKSKFRSDTIEKIVNKYPELDPNFFKGKTMTPYKKLNQNVVAEEGPVYNPRKPQENYQMQTIDHEFLLAITKQLEVKDDQIRTLTKIIENITTK